MPDKENPPPGLRLPYLSVNASSQKEIHLDVDTPIWGVVAGVGCHE